MAKKSNFVLSTDAFALLLWFQFWSLASAFDPTSLIVLFDQELLGVNLSWPSGAKFTEQDCCDGNTTDPTSLSPFLEGPPTITVKVNHDETFPANYILDTKDSLLTSKYIVMMTLYNQTQDGNTTYQDTYPVWMQGNMTASTPGGIISDNNTFVTLSNDTEPLLSYFLDFNTSDITGALLFDETIWQMSVGVYQQTPELEDYLYTKDVGGGDPKQNQTLLALRLLVMFEDTMFGTENPSQFWNSTSPSPWGRNYVNVPGTFDAVVTAGSSSAAPSATGPISTAPSSSSTVPSATTSHSAATREHIYGGATLETVLLSTWMMIVLLASVLI